MKCCYNAEPSLIRHKKFENKYEVQWKNYQCESEVRHPRSETNEWVVIEIEIEREPKKYRAVIVLCPDHAGKSLAQLTKFMEKLPVFDLRGE